jgi:hypothetical protein
MVNLNSLLLFSEAPKKLVDFYRQVLAREPKWQEVVNGVKSLSFINIFHAPAKIHSQRISTESVPFLDI